MLLEYERNGHFNGIPIDPGRLSISHLFFADDSLIFFKATRDGCSAIKQCLSLYERASGQVVNFDKSAITFSPSTNQNDAQVVRQILNINVVQGHALYLGLPTFSIRQKRIQFGYIRDRVQRKLASWRFRPFSAGGKEVLLKTVVQAIPSYTMSCFRLPEAICSDIYNMCAGFWWGDEENRRKMHWAKWSALCKPKERGGLGFRDIRSFNRAMLAKQVWRILNNPTSLVARVLKARYFRNGEIMTAEVRSSASYVWRSLVWSRNLIKKGLFWRVGNGQQIRALQDAWIPNLLQGTLSKGIPNMQDIRVVELIGSDGQWDMEIIEQICLPHEQEAIIAVEIDSQNMPERSYWKFEGNGRYSVKSGYLAEIGYYDPPDFSAEHNKSFWNATVWFLKIPPKVKFFLWRALNNFIPVEANLLRHHVPAKGLCYHCGKFVATTEHCFIFCERIRSTWKESRFWSMLKKHKSRSFHEIGEILHKELSVEDFEIWVVVLWMIWKYICKAKHNKNQRQELVSGEHGVLFWKIAQEARSYMKIYPLLGAQPGEHRWRKPENGTLRMDVDAMFNPTRKKFGIGIIVRDARCEIVAAMAMPMTAMGTVLRAEIMAILQGITFCFEEKIGPIAIYTDSLLAVRAMRGMDADFDILPDDLQEMVLSTKKENVIGTFHAYRSATLAAHNLAQFTMQISDRVVWKSNFPAWLVNVVSNDFE